MNSWGLGCCSRAEVAPILLKLMGLPLPLTSVPKKEQNYGFWSPQPYHQVRLYWCCQLPPCWSLGRQTPWISPEAHPCRGQMQALPVAKTMGQGNKSSHRVTTAEEPQGKEHWREFLQRTLAFWGVPGSCELMLRAQRRLVTKLSTRVGKRCLQPDSNRRTDF